MDQYPGQVPPPNSPEPGGYPQQPEYQQGNLTQPGAYPPATFYPGQPGYPQQPEYQQGNFAQPGTYPPVASYPGQPGYPQQPGYPPQPGAYLPSAPYPGQPGYVPPQPPRKKRTGVWIALLVVVVIVLAVGGVGYFVVLPKILQASPNSVLQTFCDGYKNLNGQEVYGTFSTALQAKPGDSESQITEGFALIKAMGATVDSCVVSNVQQSGSTATATITISATALGKSNTSSEQVSLVLENGAWKINDIQDSGSSL